MLITKLDHFFIFVIFLSLKKSVIFVRGVNEECWLLSYFLATTQNARVFYLKVGDFRSQLRWTVSQFWLKSYSNGIESNVVHDLLTYINVLAGF